MVVLHLRTARLLIDNGTQDVASLHALWYFQVGKAAAVTFGVVFVTFQAAAQAGYVNVNWDAVGGAHLSPAREL